MRGYFLQKSKSNSSVLASIHSFVAFWLEILPPTQWRTFDAKDQRVLLDRRL